MAAVAQIAHGIAIRNLVGVEAAAAHEYIKRQQDVPAAGPTTAPVDDAGAVSTLLSAYMSANPSLHTANAEIISMISSFALAQAAYNSALERGETPPPPVLALPANTGTGTLTALPTGSDAINTGTGTGRTTLPTGSSTTSSVRSTPNSAPTGAAGKKYLVGKLSVLGLCGLVAVLALAS